MEINLILTDLKSSFMYSSTLRHVSRIDYDVDFNSNNIHNVISKVEDLYSKVSSGVGNNKCSYYTILEVDVIHIKELLIKVIDFYKKAMGITYLNGNTKLSDMVLKLEGDNKKSEKESDLIKNLHDHFLPAKTENLTTLERLRIKAKSEVAIL